jgi:hypothetical protein
MDQRGYHLTDEGRAAMSERVRRTGQSAAGARAAHAKYGSNHPGLLAIQRMWAIPGTRKLQRVRFWLYLHERGYTRAQVLKRVRAAHRRLTTDGSRRGRPAQFFADESRAIEASRLRGEGKTKGEIAEALGLLVYCDESGYTRANRVVDELIASGDALRWKQERRRAGRARSTTRD